MKIIINAREVEIKTKSISYSEIVKLAGFNKGTECKINYKTVIGSKEYGGYIEKTTMLFPKENTQITCTASTPVYPEIEIDPMIEYLGNSSIIEKICKSLEGEIFGEIDITIKIKPIGFKVIDHSEEEIALNVTPRSVHVISHSIQSIRNKFR